MQKYNSIMQTVSDVLYLIEKYEVTKDKEHLSAAKTYIKLSQKWFTMKNRLEIQERLEPKEIFYSTKENKYYRLCSCCKSLIESKKKAELTICSKCANREELTRMEIKNNFVRNSLT